jgi:hypothetical protein
MVQTELLVWKDRHQEMARSGREKCEDYYEISWFCMLALNQNGSIIFLLPDVNILTTTSVPKYKTF